MARQTDVYELIKNINFSAIVQVNDTEFTITVILAQIDDVISYYCVNVYDSIGDLLTAGNTLVENQNCLATASLPFDLGISADDDFSNLLVSYEVVA